MLRNLIVTALLATSISFTPAMAQDTADAKKPVDEGINLMQQLFESEGIEVKNNQIQNFDAVFWDPAKEL